MDCRNDKQFCERYLSTASTIEKIPQQEIKNCCLRKAEPKGHEHDKALAKQ